MPAKQSENLVFKRDVHFDDEFASGVSRATITITPELKARILKLALMVHSNDLTEIEEMNYSAVYKKDNDVRIDLERMSVTNYGVIWSGYLSETSIRFYAHEVALVDIDPCWTYEFFNTKPKATHFSDIKVPDPDAGGTVELSLFKHQNGGLFAIDFSFLDQVEDKFMPDPFNPGRNVELEYPEPPTLSEIIEQMKTEVLRDISTGRVPETVSSFSELHDYVDANYYGGFIEDDKLATLISSFGGRDINGAWPEKMIQFVNDAQDAIDAWLRNGRN